MLLQTFEERDVEVCDSECVGHYRAEGSHGPYDVSWPMNVYVGPVEFRFDGAPLWAVWEEDPECARTGKQEFQVYEFESEAREEARKRSTGKGEYNEEDYL